jgi:hypothetical protein
MVTNYDAEFDDALGWDRGVLVTNNDRPTQASYNENGFARAFGGESGTAYAGGNPPRTPPAIIH